MTQVVIPQNAQLLINDYRSIDDIKRRILDAHYKAADPNAPACRFRGSVVDFRGSANGSRLLGWQRNIARLRKLDVSLPALISLRLDGKGIIEAVELDAAFKGSKGLLCSHKYLDALLKRQLQGRSFGNNFLQAVKQEKMHCAHLFEVLSGLYSYYQIIKENSFREIFPENYAYEEEAIDSYILNGTIHSLGVHLMKGNAILEFRLSLHDIMHHIGFDKGGALSTTEGIRADFILNGKLLASETVTVNTPNTPHMDLTRFLLLCTGELKNLLCSGKSMRLFNTNLYPRAYIGMFIQVAAIRLFHDNYNYIMHALTALQRPGGVPACLGALSGQEEADRYFPGYDFSDLI